MRVALAASLILALITRGAQAQSAIVDSYQENDGLTNMTARCLTQATGGMLWICTDGGLFRFDGFRAHREPLPVGAGKAIDNALADHHGHLWVQTRTGLYLRREVDGAPRWSAVLRADGKKVFVDPGQRLAMDDRDALLAMDWRNRLWSVTVPASPSEAPVAQRVVLPEFPPFEETREARGGPVLAVGRALWFGCGSGLCLFRDGHLATWGSAQGLPPASWSALLLARDGSLWARSSRGLAHLAPGGERFTTIDAPLALRFAGSIALAQDPMGAIVTATDDGLARWDGRQWRRWTQRDGMPETVVRALIFDAEGFLWLGTNARGLHRWIGYGAVDHWTTASGLPHPAVTALARMGDGRLWAATAKGVAWLDESAHRFRTLSSPLTTDGLVSSLGVDARGALWWVDAGRLLMLRPTETKPQVISTDVRLGQIVQGVGGLYLATPGGSQRLIPSPPYLRREPSLADMQEAEPLVSVLADGEHEWFQTGRYLCRMERNACVKMRDERGTPMEAPGNAAAFIGPSDLWIGDDRGISVYALHDTVAHLVRRIDGSSFGDATIGALHADSLHRMWVATDRGIFVFDQDQWSHIDRTSGLVWNDVNTGAFLLDPDGTAWIGTSAGATQIHPGLRRTTAPALRPDELQFGAHTTHAAPQSPIAWVDRQLRVTVGTPSIGLGHGARIEYRLHDSGPWKTIEGNVIQLEALASDSYLLQLRAAAQLPIGEPGPALRIPFEIAPPWWAATPMRLGYAAGVVGLWCLSVVALRRRATATRRRLEQAIAERTDELERSREALRELGEYNARSLESERKRVSRELHDEMGQQLAALRMEFSVLRMRVTASKPLATGMLDTLLERVDGLVASVRTLVSQLRPPALDGGLIVAIEWLAAEFTRSTGVACRLELDPAARELSSDAATMVFRIAQESFANVRDHAGARHVSVTLQPGAGRWALEVRDDGVGFDAAAPHAGFGLLGMAERARTLGGELSITSTPGKGATIRLEIAAPSAR